MSVPTVLAGTVDKAAEAVIELPWRWPIKPEAYSRSPALTSAETAALAALGDDIRWWRRIKDRAEWLALSRLAQPLLDARAKVALPTARQADSADAAVGELLRLCHVNGLVYWGWTSEIWHRVLGKTQAEFLAAHPTWVDREVRQYLIAYAYLLRCFVDLPTLGGFKRMTLAAKIFGSQRVQDAVSTVHGVLREWGYYQSAQNIGRIVCEALLRNLSPRLGDLSVELLDEMRQGSGPERRSQIFELQRGLASLGLLPAPTGPGSVRPEVSGVAAVWLDWVTRWEATSTLAPATRKHIRTCLLKAGRWLGMNHPEVDGPADWSRELCAKYVAAVDRMRVGDWAQRHEGLHGRLGKPLSARSKASYIAALRQFFRDCQEWEWVPRRFDPARALATPRSVKALIGPSPRVIADHVWARLLWAGLNLSAADLPEHTAGHFYPLELIKALALVWLFSGLRSDEIARLRVGCVRWQADRPEGNDTPICLLDVPAHKTGTPFTKPVDPLVGRAIEAWEAKRPPQPLLTDNRTGEAVSFLFCIRAKRVAKQYINEALIPLLCRKSGVPPADARGTITSHRARATIASQLYNAKEPMTLFELQAWLGHRSPTSTQHYTGITPARLAQAYSDAGYFARNVRTIEVLIDRDAVEAGAAADGVPWQYFDLGPAYCTYTFFEQCHHRLACARCDFCLPKASSGAQLLEAKENLQQMQITIHLTDDEQAAVEDGKAAIDLLLQRLPGLSASPGNPPCTRTGPPKRPGSHVHPK